jgi:hypothetical protein
MFGKLLAVFFLVTMCCAEGYYNLPYYYPEIEVPYEPENGPMRGPNSIQGHQIGPHYYDPYGAYPFTPYEPENGPMRGPNSLEGHFYG